jgi:flagellar basal-body rod protein FlgF
MLRGIYIAAGGLSGREQAIDVITNNLANVDTTGYKADKLSSTSFGRMFLSRISDAPPEASSGTTTPPVIGPAQLSGGITEAKYVDYSPGSVTFSNNPLDLALEGPGFMKVQDTNRQVFYTRDGAFTISSDRYLVNQGGFQVLDAANRPIQILSPGEIVIEANGDLSIDGLPAGRIGLAEFTNLNDLQKAGSNLFSAGTGAIETAATETLVIQGAVERSNVNAVSALTQLLARFREFEVAARSLEMIDRTLERTVNDLSRLNL